LALPSATWSDRFAAREEASRELGRYGEAAEAALKRALAGKASAEVRRRAAALLDQIAASRALRRREPRAVEVLEHIGGREAMRLLDGLAGGRPDAELTRAARAALERINGRGSPLGGASAAGP
jgi:hypothetical protein